jgi:hypothetical protein
MHQKKGHQRMVHGKTSRGGHEIRINWLWWHFAHKLIVPRFASDLRPQAQVSRKKLVYKMQPIIVSKLAISLIRLVNVSCFNHVSPSTWICQDIQGLGEHDSLSSFMLYTCPVGFDVLCICVGRGIYNGFGVVHSGMWNGIYNTHTPGLGIDSIIF